MKKEEKEFFGDTFPLIKTWPTCVFICLCFIYAGSANSASRVIKGASLTEPVEVLIDSSKDTLIVAEQKNSNVIVSLKDRNQELVILSVNIAASKFMNEYLFIEKGTCEVCYVEVRGEEAIDRISKYSIRILEANSIGSELGEVYTRLSSAGSSYALADLSEGPSRAKHLGDVERELESILLQKKFISDELRSHVFLFLADTKRYLDKDMDHLEILEKMINESKVSATELLPLAYYELGKVTSNVEKKRSLYRFGIQKSKAINDPLLIAKGMNFLGISSVRQAKYEEADSLLKQAYELYEANGNWLAMLKPLHNLSWSSFRAGNYPRAISYATEQKLLAERFGAEEEILNALYNLSLAYADMGDRQVANTFLNEALSRHSSLTSHSKTSTYSLKGYLLQEKVQGLLQFGAFDLAKIYVEKLKKHYIRGNYRSLTSKAIFIEGKIYLAENKFEEAKARFISALEFDIKNNRHLSVGHRLNKLAELSLKQGDLLAAADFQKRALEQLTLHGTEKSIVRALGQATELLYEFKAYESALEIHSKSRPVIEKNGTLQLRAKLEFRDALINIALGNKLSARTSLTTARALIQEVLDKVVRRDLRQNFLALQRQVYEKSIELELEMDNGAELSLGLAEDFKARTLVETIYRTHGESPITTSQQQERKEIHNKLLGKAMEWYSGRSKFVSSKLLADIRGLSYSLESIESQRIKRNHTLRKQFVKRNISDLSGISSREAIVYYFVGDNKAWVWLLHGEKIHVNTLPNERDLKALIEPHLSQISRHPSLRKNYTAWEQMEGLKSISDTLLSSVKRPYLQGRIDHLIIVADGVLSNFPFAALPVGQAGDPIVTRSVVSYVHSLETLAALRDREKKSAITKDRRALVIADPNFSRSGVLEFPRLTHTLEEVKAIRLEFDKQAVVLTDVRATKSNILRALDQRYEVAHFATHGVFHADEPSLSGLVLSDEAGVENLWLSSEIASSNINADLVVLSACDTSAGKNVGGEGLLSLSRAFIEAGASRVVGSLWRAEDHATSVLIKRFYNNLQGGSLGAAKALQKAQAHLILDKENNWSDPYFWAGFQLQGGESSFVSTNAEI